MSLALLLLSTCSTSFATMLLDERQTTVPKTTALLDPPPCLLQCSTTLLPKFNCTSAECFCNTKEPLRDAMRSCISSACTNLGDEVKIIRLQAQVCGLKAHTDAPPTANVAYGLFTVATVFLLLRFLYRAPQLNGAGYDWDDWCLLLCFPSMLVMTVTAHYASKYGSGKDVWLVSAEQLQSFFIVRSARGSFESLARLTKQCSGHTPASLFTRSRPVSVRR